MNRRLRIAMFVGSFPVVSETFILRQITGLIDLGHEVDIYADTRVEAGAPVHPDVAKYDLLGRTTFMDMPPETAPWELPVWPLTGRTWPPGSARAVRNSARLARALPKLTRCLVKAPRLTRQVLRRSEYGYQAASFSSLHRLFKLSRRSGGYDVLHAHFGPVGNSFRFARELWQAPLVVSFHGYDFSTVPRKQGADIYRRLFETADVFTVNSNYTRAQVERLGCPSAKIHKLPLGLDPVELRFHARVRQPGEPLRILTVGRLVEIKGHEYAIRAVAKMREKIPGVCYDIAGDGPLRRQLEALIGELKLETTVTLRGALDCASIQRLLEQAHLFVLASVSVEGDQEGQGLALQEAQAAGLPVIATRHGALPEGMLPGESGFLVPERDVEALAERLSYLAEHPAVWADLGRRGRSFVEAHYDVRKLSQQLNELYEVVIQNYGSAARCHFRRSNP